MLVLTRSQVEACLDPHLVLEAVESAHEALALGAAAQADRDNLLIPGSDQLLLPMIAVVPGSRAAGVKLLVDSPGNPLRGLPRQQSTVLLIDTSTGTCEAVLHGAPITAVRTAAASAVATRHLAPAGATCLGLIGAGAQAWSHLHALRLVRPIEKVWVWSRTVESAERFADRCSSLDVEVAVATEARSVVEVADIVCTLTPSVEPIVRGAWFRPEQHVNVVGAPPRMGYREVDDELLGRSRVIVDDRSVARAESGAMVSAMSSGALPDGPHADLGEVIAGLAPARTKPGQITTYLSVGVAIQDLVTARLVVDAARHLGLGTEVDMSA